MITLPQTPYLELTYKENDLLLYAKPYASETSLALVAIDKETTEEFAIPTISIGSYVSKEFVLLNVSEHREFVDFLIDSKVIEVVDTGTVDGVEIEVAHIIEDTLLEGIVTTDYVKVTMTHVDERWGTQEGLLSMFAAPIEEKRGRILSLLGVDTDKEPTLIGSIGDEVIRDPEMTIDFEIGMYGKPASYTEKKLKKLQSKTVKLIIGDVVKTTVGIAVEG